MITTCAPEEKSARTGGHNQIGPWCVQNRIINVNDWLQQAKIAPFSTQNAKPPHGLRLRKPTLGRCSHEVSHRGEVEGFGVVRRGNAAPGLSNSARPGLWACVAAGAPRAVSSARKAG